MCNVFDPLWRAVLDEESDDERTGQRESLFVLSKDERLIELTEKDELRRRPSHRGWGQAAVRNARENRNYVYYLDYHDDDDDDDDDDDSDDDGGGDVTDIEDGQGTILYDSRNESSQDDTSRRKDRMGSSLSPRSFAPFNYSRYPSIRKVGSKRQEPSPLAVPSPREARLRSFDQKMDRRIHESRLLQQQQRKRITPQVVNLPEVKLQPVKQQQQDRDGSAMKNINSGSSSTDEDANNMSNDDPTDKEDNENLQMATIEPTKTSSKPRRLFFRRPNESPYARRDGDTLRRNTGSFRLFRRRSSSSQMEY